MFGMVRRKAPGQRGLDQFYSGLLSGVDRVLDEEGASIVVHIVASLDEEVATYRRWAAAGEIEAVVLSDMVEDDPRPALCHELSLRAVAVGEVDGDGQSVRVNNDRAMADAVAFLDELGHRSIGHVTGPRELSHTIARERAFEREIAARGLCGGAVEGDYGEQSGRECTARLLDDEAGFTALVFDNDLMAAAALDVAAERGIVVPDELSVLAWDDSAVCQLATPALSAVSRDVLGLGELVARALLDPDAAAESVTQDVVIVARASTAPPAES